MHLHCCTTQLGIAIAFRKLRAISSCGNATTIQSAASCDYTWLTTRPVNVFFKFQQQTIDHCDSICVCNYDSLSVICVCATRPTKIKGFDIVRVRLLKTAALGHSFRSFETVFIFSSVKFATDSLSRKQKLHIAFSVLYAFPPRRTHTKQRTTL